ncbi:hypothetical protein GCM10008957_30310 [Deinococcus ruber]|uniref:Uncharacterized protein n=1 Tax=Deinococcus ruber TaxID=1848197 RepID=A0A918CDI8_9DEIO|nr:hypothetical protein GCM10008957_30310 [Deinococcus ruber]
MTNTDAAGAALEVGAGWVVSAVFDATGEVLADSVRTFVGGVGVAAAGAVLLRTFRCGTAVLGVVSAGRVVTKAVRGVVAMEVGVAVPGAGWLTKAAVGAGGINRTPVALGSGSGTPL